MLSDASVTTMLPVKDMDRARAFYGAPWAWKQAPLSNHVCVLGAEKAAWFKDSEGNYLCIHEDLPGA